MSKIKSAAPGWLRPATEYGPLLTFFIAFYSGGKDLITATGAFMVAVVLVILLLAVWRQKPPIMFIVTVVIVLFFGGLTLWFQDERFIKMKPTIVQSLFAIVLQSAWPLQDRGWSVLSLRFALFFIVMAILNEIVWRNVSTEIWLNFKVFGIILLTFAFTACQFPVFTRYKIEDTNPENKTDQ
jgi:intracellular septation protein